MNLHYETVSPLLKETLQKLVNSPIFKDFTLIGGTCLSLQLGHRRSIDIDLFTDIDYGTMNTKEMKEFIQRSFPYYENTDSLDTSALGYTLYMGDSPIDKIKVDFFYTEKFIFPIQEIDHIRIADIREIAAMKLSAITEEEPRQKDFWDIHELNEKYSFKDMIDWGIKRNEWSVTEEGILNGFQKIDSVKESPEGIDCFKGNYWSLVKDDLKEMVDQYLKEKDFSLAIKKNDFAQISFLKDEGYIPSPKIIDELKGSAPAPTMIAVQKIFGLPSDAPGLSNIKLAQSDSKELGLNIEKGI
ncbi:nucleotidyl transferase AbiEii/AbiGii toxin family protein [Parabacteroides timonensis]|uniref:nucleotidyl transferase AbiEii/AbiGii toxin family protein n=1 Tax=Parabacteroides timonensis TaxID=1871013 RepID=UPI00094E810E|nr:nucleotidyl transferase AbiEii/AbiGii toxin family protein [Parabacteroides timonensis]